MNGATVEKKFNLSWGVNTNGSFASALLMTSGLGEMEIVDDADEFDPIVLC